jgi:putative FmdB family regulatory protein
MPLYEYFCPACAERFEMLRPMNRATEPATCPEGHGGAKRTLSMFAAVSREAGLGVAPDSFGAGPSGGSCACGAGGCGCH